MTIKPDAMKEVIVKGSLEERVIPAHSDSPRRVPDLAITLQLLEDRQHVDITVRRIRGSGPVPYRLWLVGENLERFAAAVIELRIHASRTV